MISLGAAVPVLAPLHASIVAPSHVGEHLSAAVPRTDSEQTPHAYVPS